MKNIHGLLQKETNLRENEVIENLAGQINAICLKNGIKTKTFRFSKVSICKSGGNASKNAVTHKVTLPNSWMQEMGITPDNRDIVMIFDGEQRTIHIKPNKSCPMEIKRDENK